MTLSSFIELFGNEVHDVYEESFALFLSKPPSANLGFVSRTSSTLTLEINNLALTISQSPTLLSSSLPGGTTGAVLWSITPRLARFLSGPSCLLWDHGLLSPSSTILELGAGVSGVLALSLAARGVGRYVLSDMDYVLKLVRENVTVNLPTISSSTRKAKRGQQKTQVGLIETVALDWERDDVSTHPALSGRGELTGVIACDCIYNEALVMPFVECCVDACRLGGRQAEKTWVLVAQELRSSDVFECFLEEFTKVFQTWRIPDSVLPEELQPTAGFAIHLGILKHGSSSRNDNK